MSNFKTRSCAQLSVGEKLPPLAIDITTSLVVCGALATRDFEPVHHSKAAAVATGLPDVFMNILTSQGLMTRYATDWSGPEAVVKSVDIRLGAPNVPGMVMTLTGEVAAIDTQQGLVDIAIVGENNIWGMHMQGSVQLALPQEG
jgi:hypothetical protein